MKAEFITEVMGRMCPHLDNAQRSQLKQALEQTLLHFEVIDTDGATEEDEIDYVESFIAAKKVEGRSEKSLAYYKSTIDKMLIRLEKEVRHMNYIISGMGRAICDGIEEELKPGVMHICPKGLEHAIINTGEEDLVMLTIVVKK